MCVFEVNSVKVQTPKSEHWTLKAKKWVEWLINALNCKTTGFALIFNPNRDNNAFAFDAATN